MAQQCYGYQDGLDFCRRSGQGVTLPISQPTRGDGHQDVSDGGSSRVSPASESDNKGNPPPRRRIQVAVSILYSQGLCNANNILSLRSYSAKDAAKGR